MFVYCLLIYAYNILYKSISIFLTLYKDSCCYVVYCTKHVPQMVCELYSYQNCFLVESNALECMYFDSTRVPFKFWEYFQTNEHNNFEDNSYIYIFMRNIFIHIYLSVIHTCRNVFKCSPFFRLYLRPNHLNIMTRF